jgi:hypothetical protein
MINIDKNLFEEFVTNIEESKNFSFSRWGDGEWALILKKEPTYTHIEKKWGPELLKNGSTLKNIILSSPKYIIGMQPLAYNNWKDDIEAFIPKDVETANSDIFHRNSYRGRLDPFINSLKKREVILIGPSYLKNLSLFEFTHIEVPDMYVWKHIEEITQEIRKTIKKDVVILYSCSIMSNVLIDVFFKEFGVAITQIDTGSLWDPYAGVNSRSYHEAVIDRIGIPKHKIIYPKLK